MHVCSWVNRFIFLVLSLASAGLRVWGADMDERPAFARAPYLQFSTTNSIYVVWRSEGPVTPVVKWGSRLDQLTSELSYVSDTSGTGIVVRT